MPELHGFTHVFRPAPGESRRTLLMLHGTGGDEGSLVPLADALDPEAAVLSPRGRVMEGPMPRFFRRLAEGVFDEADLRLRTEELADFISAATTEYGLSDEIVAVGYSNGANIAASTLLLRPEVLAGAVLLRPMVPLVPETPPNLTGTRVLMASGRYDGLVPVDNAERLAVMLREAGADVTLAWADAGHELLRSEIDQATAWLGADDSTSASA